MTPSTCGAHIAYRSPDPARPRYRMQITVRRRSPVVVGRERVVFTPDSPTARLVFRLWPNGPVQRREGGSLELTGPVSSPRGQLPTRMPDPTTLVVGLPSPLRPGEPIAVTLGWRLRVPVAPHLDRIARAGPELRLGSFFPILAWQPGVGWATDPPTTILAEASTSPTSDFDVRVRAPSGKDVLATGVELSPGHWRATAVRDFAIAVDRFRLATVVAHAPRAVRVTVGAGPGVTASPQAAARRAAGYLRQFDRRFGPYPWPALTIPVTVDVGSSGIEYPNLIFIGASGVRRTLSHEIAHQWFYSLVGNDQARDPWLDEGLATYAQVTADHLQSRFGHFGMPPRAAGHLGEPMAYWDRLPYLDYATGVYLQGERALSGLGPQSLVDCGLRRYVAANAYGIATQLGLAGALGRVIPGAPARLRRLGARVGG